MSTATTHWNRVSRRPLADILDELGTARTLAFEEQRPGIVVMTVNRPHRANSQTVEMFGEIAWAATTLRNGPLRLTSPASSLKDFVSAIHFVFLTHPFRVRRKMAVPPHC